MSNIHKNLVNIINIKNEYNNYLLANKEKQKVTPFEYKFLFDTNYYSITNPFDIVENEDNQISIIIYEKDFNPDLGRDNSNKLVKVTVNLSKIANNDYVSQISEQFKDNSFILKLKSLINTMDNLVVTSHVDINQLGDRDNLHMIKENYESLKNRYEQLENSRNKVVISMNRTNDSVKDNLNMLIQTELFYMLEIKKIFNSVINDQLLLINDFMVENIFKEFPKLGEIYSHLLSEINVINSIIDISNKNKLIKNYLLKMKTNQLLESTEEKEFMDILSSLSVDVVTWWKEHSSEKTSISQLICSYTFYVYLYHLSILNKVKTKRKNLTNSFEFIHINNKLGNDTLSIEYNKSDITDELNMEEIKKKLGTPPQSKQIQIEKDIKTKNKKRRRAKIIKTKKIDKHIGEDLPENFNIIVHENLQKLIKNYISSGYLFSEPVKFILQDESSSLLPLQTEFINNLLNELEKVLDENWNSKKLLPLKKKIITICIEYLIYFIKNNEKDKNILNYKILLNILNNTKNIGSSKKEILSEQVKKELEQKQNLYKKLNPEQMVELQQSNTEDTESDAKSRIIDLQLTELKEKLKKRSSETFSGGVDINFDDETLENKIEQKKSECLDNNKYLVLTYKTDSFYFSVLNALNEHKLLDFYKLSNNISLLDVSYNNESMITSLHTEAMLEMKKGLSVILKNNKSNINSSNWLQPIDNYIEQLNDCSSTRIDEVLIKLTCLLLDINISVVNFNNMPGTKIFSVENIRKELGISNVFKNNHSLKEITLISIDNTYFYISEKNDVERNNIFYERISLYSIDIKYNDINYSIVYFRQLNDNIKMIGFIDKVTLQIQKFKANQKVLVNNICEIFQNIKNKHNILDDTLEEVTKYDFWKNIYSEEFYQFKKFYTINDKYCNNSNNKNYENTYIGVLTKYGKLKSTIIDGKCNLNIVIS